MNEGVGFGCECYFDNSSGERIYITSFTRAEMIDYLWDDIETSIHMMSDHVVLWYDPVICNQIMEEIKAIIDVNNTNYNPKLTFTFFVVESSLNEVETIQECGFRWIYQGKMASSTNLESHDQEEIVSSSNFQSNDQEEIVPPKYFESNDQEETIPSTNKSKQCVFGTPSSSLELDDTKDMR
ncbi:TIR-NBS-LRR resistance protein [Trifolium medium]|uniref:TIR-NBS-LRR resistance protein n=1 Tax=Trifolium medium TaxID=97028 RepID=A0A392NB82_9FABA|nr:TIR-NBS-LRR resistance protein [Trifolium medium]